MLIPSDYKDLLRTLNKHRVRYLIIGAYAVIYYTEPRYTKDIDIWVESTIKNARRTFEALKEFGAPLKGIEVEDFANKNLVYQMGVAPIRVDIIMGLSDIDFNSAWRQRVVADFEGHKVNIIGIHELIKAKKKTNRDLDKRDIEALQSKLKIIKKGK